MRKGWFFACKKAARILEILIYFNAFAENCQKTWLHLLREVIVIFNLLTYPKPHTRRSEFLLEMYDHYYFYILFNIQMKTYWKVLWALEYMNLNRSINLTFLGVSCPVNIYLFKANIKYTRKMCKICLHVTIKTEQRHWRRSDVYIHNFENIFCLMFTLLSLSMSLFAGWSLQKLKINYKRY